MIELVHVSKYYPTELGRHYVFRDVSLKLPLDKSVGIIGPNGAGKSTLLRLIAGADAPSEGYIRKSGRISPPMGLTPGLQATLTGSENARFAGRIYGLDRDQIADMLDHVREFSGVGKFFDLPVSSYSAGMRQRVAFAINMAMEFDYYLFDEIAAGGDREFQKIAKAMVAERLKTSKFLIATHRSDELLGICDAGIVIRDGTLTYFDDIGNALAAYGVDEESDGKAARRRAKRSLLAEAVQDVSATPAGKAAAPRQPKLTESELAEKRKATRALAEARRAAAAAAAGATPAEVPAPPQSKEERRARLLALRAERLARLEAGGAAPADPAMPPAAGQQQQQPPAEAEAPTPQDDTDRLAALRERRRARIQALHGGGEAAAAAAERPEPAAGALARIKAMAEERDAGRPDDEASPPRGETAAAVFQRAARFQIRAQAKSARALQLLLDHLNAGGKATEEGREAAIAAQNGAAEEAALVRKLIESARQREAAERTFTPDGASAASNRTAPDRANPMTGREPGKTRPLATEPAGHRNT